MSVSVCVSVCLSPRSYLLNFTFDLHQFFLCILPMAMAQSTSGGVVIRSPAEKLRRTVGRKLTFCTSIVGEVLPHYLIYRFCG